MKILKLIPNTITLMNLLCGLAGVILTFEGKLEYAFIMMLAAALCDFCDGLAARLLGAYSELGKELDSLSDVVSFGVLPSLMLFKAMSFSSSPVFLQYSPLILAAISSLRLAKFNLDTRQSDSFIGLATPAAAMISGSLVCFVHRNPDSFLAALAATSWFIPALTIFLSLLLVSEIPMFSMKLAKGRKTDLLTGLERKIFLILSALTIAAVVIFKLDWTLIILLIFLLYISINLAFLFVPREKS